MGNIKINAEHEQSRRNVKIVRGVFETKLEMEHDAGLQPRLYPSP